MPLLLITYDLRAETKRPDIVKLIRDTYPSNCKLCDSSYVVETQDTPDTAHRKLGSAFDNNDWRAIINLGNEWQGLIAKEDAGWLNARIYRNTPIR